VAGPVSDSAATGVINAPATSIEKRAITGVSLMKGHPSFEKRANEGSTKKP
jgi:hypothetical protein